MSSTTKIKSDVIKAEKHETIAKEKKIGENDQISCWFKVILGLGTVDDKILVTGLMPFLYLSA